MTIRKGDRVKLSDEARSVRLDPQHERDEGTVVSTTHQLAFVKWRFSGRSADYFQGFLEITEASPLRQNGELRGARARQ